MTASSRYKLFSAKGSTKARCAFFASPAGCRNGDTCKFSHGDDNGDDEDSSKNTPMDTSSSSDDSASAVSSESEEEMTFSPPVVLKKNVTKKNQKVKERKSNDGKKRKAPSLSDISGSSLFAKPEKKQYPEKKEQKRPAANHRSPATSISSTRLAPTPQPTTPTFRNLNLPVASFSVPSNENKNLSSTPQQATKKAEELEVPKRLPKHTKVGKSWLPVVEATRSHPLFGSIFDFGKEIESELEAKKCTSHKDWFVPKKFGSWCKSNPQAIAIDCEMCETRCPETGAVNSRALCRLSVVDAENPEDVLLDTLVKPDWPVSDYRTWVNGITREHLADVKFTMAHAQNFMKALCSQETVIVGHALHNDLFSLRMVHNVVADSALLFVVKDAEDPQKATCSLFDLTYHIQKLEMPHIHDSVNDARMALLNIVEGWKNKGGENIDEIPRSKKNPKLMSSHNPKAAAQLFCHRIPIICQPEHLQAMFEEHTHVIPTSIDPIEFGGKKVGKTLVTFASVRHANLAFSMLDGNAVVEKSGRSQKKVMLRNSKDYINIRKMVHDLRGGERGVSNDSRR